MNDDVHLSEVAPRGPARANFHSPACNALAGLTDEDLSNTMPEVFDSPPEIIASFMAYEAEHVLLRWNPLNGASSRSADYWSPAPSRRCTRVNRINPVLHGCEG
jgi:hypothetical protein